LETPSGRLVGLYPDARQIDPDIFWIEHWVSSASFCWGHLIELNAQGMSSVVIKALIMSFPRGQRPDRHAQFRELCLRNTANEVAVPSARVVANSLYRGVMQGGL
jgi:hypothetical protein